MAVAERSPEQPARAAILALSAGALELGRRLAAAMPADLFPCRGQVQECFTTQWQRYEALICIMATGIVVRQLAPLVQSKYRDPAVLVLDERGRFVISLLSGHLGGGNALAQRVAALTGGQAVLTTASDVLGLTALDIWARSLGLQVADKQAFTRAMGRLVDRGSITLWSDLPLPPLPPDIQPVEHMQEADLLISCHNLSQSLSQNQPRPQAALLLPRALCIGIGCNRGTDQGAIAEAVDSALAQHGLDPRAVARLASIDLKADEAGLLAYAAERQLPLDFFDKDALNTVEAVQYSEAVFRATGARGVAEPAALLAAGPGALLLVPKMKWPDVTVAVARMANPLAPPHSPSTPDGQTR